MTTPHLAGHPAASQQAIVDAALLMLQQMGLSPDDLVTAPKDRPPVPTFAEYVPVVSAAVTAGTRRAYGSYWNRVLEHWGERRLDEIAPSEIRQLMSYVKTHVVARRNARGGRSATEHLVAALRCLYKHAEDDGLITPGENPARKVDKPRRLPSTRRAVTDDRLAEICQAAADGGDDPELDTLLLRLHTETACRRGGALALRPDDLDSGQCLIRLREKGESSAVGRPWTGTPGCAPLIVSAGGVGCSGAGGLVSLDVSHWCSAMCGGFYAPLVMTSLMAVRVGNDS